LSEVTINSENENIVSVAKPRSTFSDHIEHWLNIGWGASNDPQDFTRSSLLL
jgi:hypothetical protein